MFSLIFEQTVAADPIYVHDERGDYYIVPFHLPLLPIEASPGKPPIIERICNGYIEIISSSLADIHMKKPYYQSSSHSPQSKLIQNLMVPSTKIDKKIIRIDKPILQIKTTVAIIIDAAIRTPINIVIIDFVNFRSKR